MELAKGSRLDYQNQIRKDILKLAWPVIIEQSLVTITQIIDMMMVGRLGAAAVTAVGLTVQPLMFFMAFIAALNVGTTALVARFTGAGEEKKGNLVLKQSLLASLLFIVPGVILFYFLAEWIMVSMGATGEVIPQGVKYLQILVPGFIFMVLNFIITAALRGAGDTTTPMKVNVLINIINVIGNYLLIFGNLGLPRLGLAGAGVATSLARGVGGILLLLYVWKGNGAIKLQGAWHLDLTILKRIFNIGFPASLEQLVMRTAQIFFVRVVSGLGTVAFAAHQIAINAESISYMPGFGIAVAATTLVGQGLGAGDPEKAERSTYEAWKIGAVIMGFMALVFLAFPEYLMKLYTDDPEIISRGALNLRIISLAQIPMGTQFIFAGSLRGAGDTKAVFYATAFSSWVARLGIAWIFIRMFNWGLVGAWLAMVIDWLMRGTFVYYRFRQGNWKKLRV